MRSHCATLADSPRKILEINQLDVFNFFQRKKNVSANQKERGVEMSWRWKKARDFDGKEAENEYRIKWRMK